MNKHCEKRRHATGLKGLCLINDSGAALMCNLVHDFLENGTVTQLPNDMQHFICFLYENKIPPDVDVSLTVAVTKCCFFSVYRLCPNRLLLDLQRLKFKTRKTTLK